MGQKFFLWADIDGEYKKFNNNWSWTDDERNTPQAFSHFTYERSNYKILVCDIQGVGDTWTDPQIHSSNGEGYGKGNMGQAGIDKFFGSHRCNGICAYLKLPCRGVHGAAGPSDEDSGTVVRQAPSPGRQDVGIRHEKHAQPPGPPGRQDVGIRQQKGMCDVCRLPVFVDEERTKNWRGAYVHLSCWNASGAGGEPRPQMAQMDLGVHGAHARRAGAHEAGVWPDSSAAQEQLFREKEKHRREKEALQAELERIKAQRREEWKAEAAVYQAEQQKHLMSPSQAPAKKSPDAAQVLVAEIKQMGFTDAQARVASAYSALGSEADKKQIINYIVDHPEGHVPEAPARRDTSAKNPLLECVRKLEEMGYSPARIESAQQACLEKSGGRVVDDQVLLEHLIEVIEKHLNEEKKAEEASLAEIRKIQQQDAQAQAARNQTLRVQAPLVDADARHLHQLHSEIRRGTSNANDAKLVTKSPGKGGWHCKYGCGRICEEESQDEKRCSRQSGSGMGGM